MDTNQAVGTGVRVLGPGDGEVAGAPESRTDRFMIDSKDTGGRLSVVEHTLPPHVLAGPLHSHSRQEVFAEAGDLVFKPRGQWHTFWNPGDTTTRILELISPGGFEDLFRELGALGDEPDPATLEALGARYGVEGDFERTAAILQRYGLRF